MVCLVPGHLEQICPKVSFADRGLIHQDDGKAIQHKVLRIVRVVKEAIQIGRKRVSIAQHQLIASGCVAGQILPV